MGLFDNKKNENSKYGFFSIFMEDTSKKKKEEKKSIFSNKSKYTDKELDAYGLEDWQKKEVKKGNYDPWNFEEEDLDEDDYYKDEE